MYQDFKLHLENELTNIEQAGLYKKERIIVSPQGAKIRVADGKEVLNFCANNYLGLSNDPSLIDAAKKGLEPGDLTVLKRYEKLRRNENLKMMTVMDIFYRVFSNEVLPVKFIRNLGLGLAERILPAKNKIMRNAMGLEGNLPKLARGERII